jgi:predicted ATPase/class 3 adenylate cyclase
MICGSCGARNSPGRKFCGECGSPLALACPTCGAPNEPEMKFCGECGSQLAGPARASVAVSARPESERRLVSVLFADLVGFTTLSETRDSEDVRELLSSYFETCRTLIERYGGAVEKFIGDAVMAVWGAPVAREDDAERAVRAALDLVAAVAALGEEVGAPDLKARAGVLTGEAAVTLGAEGQGMVAGDLVNTASRIQAVAPSGQVFVGEAAKRSTEAAIAYEDAGLHELKGKAEPVPLWWARRVVAGVRGALKSRGLEAPFVGRDRELRMMKELFHASVEEGKAHLVSVLGIAGIGKSRLSWEFFKYIDGLAGGIWWHRGRCLSYGEGVTYWALAEMVKMRSGILEDEDPLEAAAKLRAAVEEHVPDPEERAWVEPRLAHLLGIEERISTDRGDLFAAWRVFFERLAEQDPVILVFEDMQWADAGLVDFIEYLLEWSRKHPLFVVTLARPELLDRRQTWGAGKANFSSLSLEPLPAQAMESLLSGLVPGLPEELAGRILDRAEGVPLYAVETVRMLLDRGLLVKDGNTFRPTGPIDALEIPETLHALIAARLDGLTADERRVIQDGSVLGKTFTAEGLSALSGSSQAQLEPLLSSLTRKEVLTVQADPRSPERGQYGFLQDLVRWVAYETLSRKEHKVRHLAAARFLEATWTVEEDEIVEVVAAHYLEAFEAAPDERDADEIREKARDMLERAGHRAASLAATEEAQRHFEQASELAKHAVVQAELLERAGQMALRGGRLDAATAHFERSIEILEREGHPHAAARVSGRVGEVYWIQGHIDRAVEQMEASFAVLSNDEPDEDLAWLTAQLGRFQYFNGRVDRAMETIERALDMAESLWAPEILSHALNTKGTILSEGKARPEEGLLLQRHALQMALHHQLAPAALRAYYNVSNVLYYHDRFEESLPYAEAGLALARRIGDRSWEWAFLAVFMYVSFSTGRWDECVATWAELPRIEDAPAVRSASIEVVACIPQLLLARGRLNEAREALLQFTEFLDSAEMQERSAYRASLAAVLRAEGETDDARAAAEEAVAGRVAVGWPFPGVKLGFVEAVEATLDQRDLARVEELLSSIPNLRAGERTPFLSAQGRRLGARLAMLRGETERIEADLKAAAGLFSETGMPFWLAVTLLEHGEWLVEQGISERATPLLEEAGAIFERLHAGPWLERLKQLAATKVPIPTGS